MTDNWRNATQHYQAADSVRQQQEKGRLAAMVQDQALQDRSHHQQQTDIDLGTAELEQFLRDEGRDAVGLLRASKRHINFGENYEGGGVGEVYFIDSNGLQKSTEAMGTWVAYSKDVPKPKIESISARQAIHAAVQHGGKKALEFVSWLHTELDKIASAASATK